MGRRTPIRPVEHTATLSVMRPRRSATREAVAAESAKPSGPVQALAPPELRMTACSWPSATACRDHFTGAAKTRLLVKTAAADMDGPRLRTSATSARPLGLRPAVTPAATNPWGAVMLTGPLLPC